MKGFVRFACVVALVLIGFAHKPVAAYPIAAQIADYQLPDGSFASICFDDQDTTPHTTKNWSCEVCRLTGAILVPAAPSIGGVAIAFAEKIKVFERRLRLARALYPPSSGPRAPPASLTFM